MHSEKCSSVQRLINYQVFLICPFSQGGGIKLVPGPEYPQLATAALQNPIEIRFPGYPQYHPSRVSRGRDQAYEMDMKADLRTSDLETRKSYHSLDLKS